MASVGSFGRSTRRALVVLLAAGLTLVAIGALAAAPALAATNLTVSTTADTSQSAGACGNTGIKAPPSPLSLREAVCLGNNISGEVTINLPAGTYKLANGELFAGLAPGLTEKFVGAGSASTIVDGQGLSRVFNIDNNLKGGLKTTFTGLTVTGGAINQFGGAGILGGSAGRSEPDDELILEGVVIKKNEAGVSDHTAFGQVGSGVQEDGGILIVKNSTFSENNGNGNGGSAIAYINETGPATQGAKISNTTFTGNRVAVASTTSGSSGGTVYINQIRGESEITDSVFTNNQVSTSTSDGAGGAGIFVLGGKVTVLRSNFSGNSVSSSSTGAASGAVVLAYGGFNGETKKSQSEVVMHYNRIAGNTPRTSAIAQYAPNEATVNVSENWWGCNTEPGSSGCDGVAATGTITSTPYLKFNASASPTNVAGPDGTSTLSAGFPTDSNGTAVSAANIGSFGGTEVTWKEPTPSPATINGSTGTTKTAFAAGKATATYSPGTAAGAGHAVAVLDNATVTIPLTADQKPAITQNPTNQMVVPGATATFTAAASGTPTPTVQWERSTNGGSIFTAIPGATNTTYSFTAASGETGYKFRAVFKNSIEGIPYEATTTAANLMVGKAITTLSSTASNATIGGTIHDTATLGGGTSPGGSLTFKVYGPGDTTCATPLEPKTVTVSGNGPYTSPDYTPATVGEYRWTVEYSGDANNEAATSACNAANEKSTVSKATTALSTTATSGNAGVAIKDTGTLSGGHNPTGNIVFRVFGPNNTTCTGAVLASKTVTVNGNGEYGSGNVSPPSAGEYRWTAEYTGDSENTGLSPVCGAANETSTVSKVTPTLSTVATDAAVGGKIHDTATLGAGVTPGGSVEFIAYGPNDPTCSSVTPAYNKIVAVAGNGNYVSGEFEALAAGTYTWKVIYSGDGNNQPVTSPCGAANETSTVAEAAPTISTVATDGTLGGTIHDTATLLGGVSPGGIVTFKAFGPNDSGCTKGPVFSRFVAVSGNGEYGSTNFTPTAAGQYNWTAEYSGDGNNKAVSSTCEAAGETSTVGKASPTISTAATNATIGGPIHDTATVAAGVTPGGSIEFKVYGPDDATCSTLVETKTVAVSANGEYSSGNVTPAATGAYRWTASYSGDANNNSVASACNASGETSQVSAAAPTISTTATSAAIGSPIHDTATLAGGVTPGGSIEFKVYGPNNATCMGNAVETSTVAVTANGEYGSGDFTPATAGSYNWSAKYSGDAKNGPVASSCGDAGETSTVSQAEPTIATTATSAKIGNPIHDTATIAGGHSAGGSIEFNAYAPGDTTCIGTPAETKTVTVSGNGEFETPGFTPTALGDYRWTAAYSGDANNKTVASACGAAGETSTISQATPTISTAATSATVGGPIHDMATIAGGYNAGGSIEFNAYAPGDTTCTGTPAETKTVTVSGNGEFSSPDFTPTALGDYRWTAAYSGDTNNAGATSACGASGETSTISQAEPTLSATATPTAAIGSPIDDTATIAGGSNAGGTIVFTAYGPNDATCTGPAAFTKTVAVNGDGNYGSTDFTPATAGEYRWTVEYTGDTDNKAAALACNAAGQTSIVAEAAPVLATSATDAVLGSPVHDTATLTGGQGPTGTIVFKAFAAGNTACTGAPAFTKTVTVNGNGSYGSGDFTPAAVGAYRWTAAYSGDANNTPAEGRCGDSGETSTVSPVPPPPVIPIPAPTPTPNPAPAPPALCTAPSATANGYVPTKKVTTGLVPGVRARIVVAEPSNLQIAATLKYKLNGKSHSADLGSALLENPGARNLRLALPTALRESLPLGTKVRLVLQIAVAPAAGSPCAAPQHRKVTVKTRVVQILAQS